MDCVCERCTCRHDGEEPMEKLFPYVFEHRNAIVYLLTSFKTALHPFGINATIKPCP